VVFYYVFIKEDDFLGFLFGGDFFNGFQIVGIRRFWVLGGEILKRLLEISWKFLD
jgi:hypothetical protein